MNVASSLDNSILYSDIDMYSATSSQADEALESEPLKTTFLNCDEPRL